MSVQFGWRSADFPLDGSGADAFRDQIFAFLDEFQSDFDSAWVADHFIPWHASIDQSIPTLDCWTTLTYLCARYTKLKFGSIVMGQSYRQPALVAKQAAILQLLSGGRFILGMGAGWKENEYRAYGYDFPSAAARIEQLSEAVQIIKSMFRQPLTTFHGKYHHVDEAICEPKPQPIPPLLIGGSGRKRTLRVVAEHADWWNTGGNSPEEYAEILGVLDEHCRAVGRDPQSIVKTYVTDCASVAATTAEAERLAKASPFYDPAGGLIGTPDQVAARIDQYIRLGVEHIILRFVDFPNPGGARLFASEVLPRYR